jgi:hypothetical protein
VSYGKEVEDTTDKCGVDLWIYTLRSFLGHAVLAYLLDTNFTQLLLYFFMFFYP